MPRNQRTAMISKRQLGGGIVRVCDAASAARQVRVMFLLENFCRAARFGKCRYEHEGIDKAYATAGREVRV